jgi:hypothetical protein
VRVRAAAVDVPADVNGVELVARTLLWIGLLILGWSYIDSSLIRSQVSPSFFHFLISRIDRGASGRPWNVPAVPRRDRSRNAEGLRLQPMERRMLVHHLEEDRRQDDHIDASPPASRPQEDEEAQGVQEQEDR